MKRDYNSIRWDQIVYYTEDSTTFLRYKIENNSFGKSKRYKNDIAGSIVIGRYGYLSYNGHNYAIHRIIWILMNNHKDCTKHNNNMLNLELRTQAENLVLNKTAVHNILRKNSTNIEPMLSEQYTSYMGKRYYAVRVQYVDEKGKRKTKSYSYNKYGKEQAWEMAKTLKSQIATYADTIMRGSK